MKAKKGHKRPKLPKIIDFINNQCKIINKWECDTKKKGCVRNSFMAWYLFFHFLNSNKTQRTV